MEFLKNISKDFVLKKGFEIYKDHIDLSDHIYNLKELENLIKNYCVKTQQDLTFKLINVDIDNSKISFKINDCESLDLIVLDVIEKIKPLLNLKTEDLRYKINLIIDEWDKNPGNFLERRSSFNGKSFYNNNIANVIHDSYNYVYIKFLNKELLDFSCEIKFFEKEYYLKLLNKLEEWEKKTTKEINLSKFKSKIKNAILREEFEVSIEQFIKTVEIPESKENSIEKIKEVEKPGFPIKLIGWQLNIILNEGFRDGEINEQFIEDVKEVCGIDLSCLLDWEIKTGTDGYHNNDGQICDYTVEFISPDNNFYYAYNSHCLVTGWNFNDYKIVNFS